MMLSSLNTTTRMAQEATEYDLLVSQAAGVRWVGCCMVATSAVRWLVAHVEGHTRWEGQVPGAASELQLRVCCAIARPLRSNIPRQRHCCGIAAGGRAASLETFCTALCADFLCGWQECTSVRAGAQQRAISQSCALRCARPRRCTMVTSATPAATALRSVGLSSCCCCAAGACGWGICLGARPCAGLPLCSLRLVCVPWDLVGTYPPTHPTHPLLQWDVYWDQLGPIVRSVPYMTAIGNHERDWPESGDRFPAQYDSGAPAAPAGAVRQSVPRR